MIEADLPENYSPTVVDVERHAPWLMQRLLEDGSSADLRRLVATFGAERLRDWVLKRGARQLSTRSLAFWRLLLDLDAGAPIPERDLWPL